MPKVMLRMSGVEARSVALNPRWFSGVVRWASAVGTIAVTNLLGSDRPVDVVADADVVEQQRHVLRHRRHVDRREALDVEPVPGEEVADERLDLGVAEVAVILVAAERTRAGRHGDLEAGRDQVPFSSLSRGRTS